MIKAGKFIVLEGLDRSGKSSVAAYLQELLSANGSVVALNFPDRATPIGQMINQFLTSKSEITNEGVHLLFSANRWEKAKFIEETLATGKNIVCDRYWYSGVAYSVAKGMDYQWCMAADRGLKTPDLVIYLKADPELLAKRAKYGEQRFQRLEFQRKVKQGFQRIFETSSSLVKTVEVGDHSLEQIKQIVKDIVAKQLN